MTHSQFSLLSLVHFLIPPFQRVVYYRHSIQAFRYILQCVRITSRHHTMAVFSSLYIIFLGALITAVCAMPLPLDDQVIINNNNNNNVPSLNDALVADSDEDVLFDEFWQEDEDDDEDGFNFIYNLFGENQPKKKDQPRIQDDIQSAMMMVSSSSDDHVIEMAIISRAKQAFRRSSAEEQDELDLMSSDT